MAKRRKQAGRPARGGASATAKRKVRAVTTARKSNRGGVGSSSASNTTSKKIGPTSRAKASVPRPSAVGGTKSATRAGARTAGPKAFPKSGDLTSTKNVRRVSGITKEPRTIDRPSAGTQDAIQFSENNHQKLKTPLTVKQLREYKELLLKKRAELAGDVNNLTDEVVHRKGAGSSDHSSMPIHMADLGSDNWEQEFTLGLLANEHERIREIDDALARIDNKTYGICLGTDKPISLPRLRATPWAKYCIEYARAREEGRAP